MSHKRDGSFSHYDNNRHKHQKTYNSQNPNIAINGRPDSNRNGNGARSQQASSLNQKFKNRDNPVIDNITRRPDPANCEPCKLAAAEMQTGMIALLSKVEAEEMTPEGDRDVLHHARELRRLLSQRAEKSQVSQTKRKTLDEKLPVKGKYVSVPSYLAQKLEKAKDLPPLPPITEPYLEEAVFTHSSVAPSSNVQNADVMLNYERLEFLGDAYIELIASRLLYSRFPHTDVPRQSHLREQLVRNETLGQFSSAYGLPDRLKHGGHITESKAWTKVIADVFEAYVAGIVLSDSINGFKTAEDWLTRLWTPQMLGAKADEVDENPLAKDDIQRLIKFKGVEIDYREERDMIMTQGQQKYFIGLYFTGWGYEGEWLGSGEGRSKKQAALYAAMDALQKNNSVLQAAAKKKQEMIQLIRENEAKAAENEGPAEAEAEAEIETEKVALKKEDSKNTSETSPAKEGASSWLEKEKRKKEKKERREKKRSRDA